ncbi:hypothetical protein GCM10010329_60940 [Streptomyces spiroverticillatus]|uniref:DUF2180 family protein n=1 Tax=Streptomyces finlayi TaxID=67296 RepID=A0A918X3Z3_9ACTN|nr:DUF2180 family protein [Streptomyces finlayi]GHA29424.1 hypothetical protein GCM10010329_60940 [Streptomyces spiroverticillatus]GHD09858.1 hypothetical protein GCM10010334_64600 [Streptomyces finlayi]
MNCYDCHLLSITTPAVAVCCHCGAAVCPEHTKADAQDVHRTEGMGLSTLDRSARRLTCLTCHDAEHQL